MSTEAQINANRENAKHSTGPRTEAGKETSSRNHLTSGLFTHQDYVKREERELYREFRQRFRLDLNPQGVLEETLVAEIVAASWRLRRCSAVEEEIADYAEQDPFLDETKTKTIRSLERARASAHSALHRSLNQLRKIQTQRHIGFEMSDTEQQGLIDYKQVADARRKMEKSRPEPASQEESEEEELTMEDIIRLCEPQAADLGAYDYEKRCFVDEPNEEAA